ncbi:helix-turn-helix domain-containing protein [Xylophilus sp. Kf1]|nr:helix-turn-helix domain-containing protein [Xylophilus sp. Kf1]
MGANAANAMPTTRKPLAAATPIAFVRAIVAACQARGLDPSAALRQAQIAPALLVDDTARITAGQFEALSAHAMQAIDDEGLGWFSRRLPWGSYGLLMRASVTAPTLAVALKRWCRHHRLLTDDVLLHLAVDGERASLWLEERRPPPDALRELCLVTLLRYVHGFASWAIDSRIALLGLGFARPAPPHADVYPLLFGCTPTFGTAVTRMDFDARYLALPLVRDETAMRAMLQRALQLTVRLYRRDRLLVGRVDGLLQDQPGATAETLAAALAMSVRTLHRQLGEEGASLQALKDASRRSRAMALLRTTDKPLKQVALAVGFRNEKSFARAFRGWTGVAPGAWRAAGAGAGD